MLAKTSAGIDKACLTVSEIPECHIYGTGTLWTSTVLSILNGSYATTYCGSPSGAFID